jgi:hypothetical protein
MTQPTAFGRKLPKNDSERDDATPGAAGKWVTCVDTAAGRMVAWATNGRTDRDGRIYRAGLNHPDPDGITLQQVGQAIHNVTGLNLVVPIAWTWSNVSSWLMAGNGLIGIGKYSTLPPADRFQDAADFDHGLFFCYRSLSSGVRTYDALNPDTFKYGKWLNAGHVRAFLDSGADAQGHYQVAYVPLQHL